MEEIKETKEPQTEEDIMSLMREAKELKEQLIAQNKEARVLLTKNILGGKSAAGEPEAKPAPVETPREYAKRIMSGRI